MSAALLERAKELERSAKLLLSQYEELKNNLSAARIRAADARDERGLMQIAVDSYLEAEETTYEICEALKDVEELSKDLSRELGEVK